MNPIVNPQQSTRHRLHQVLKVKSERNTRPLGSGLGLGSGLRRQFGKRRSWLAFELSIPIYGYINIYHTNAHVSCISTEKTSNTP